METDVLGHTIRGVLSQEQEEKWKPITFLLRIIQIAKRNYKIYNKALLVIVEALTKWRQYLLDTTKKFKVWTDHIMILFCNTFEERQTQLQIFCQERIKWIPKTVTRTSRYLKTSYKQGG